MLSRKLERVEALKGEAEGRLRESSLAIQHIQEVIGVPGDVWMKAKLFDAQLEKAGHVLGSKMVGFLVSQAAKMEGLLGTMRTLILTMRDCEFVI